jgi:hypothetical protein
MAKMGNPPFSSNGLSGFLIVAMVVEIKSGQKWPFYILYDKKRYLLSDN